MPRRRHSHLLVAAGLLAASLAACDADTIAIRFDPAVGDRYAFRSDIRTEVVRTIDAETTTERNDSTLDATETITAVDGDEITVGVALGRDGAPPRTYSVRFDRSDRLTAIDLVEGVPAEALGLDLATDLPADVGSPPEGPLEVGTRWQISRTVDASDGGTPTTVTGTGRVVSLGVQDGHDVAVVVVELRVPIRSTIVTADGLVDVQGVQTSTSRTTYDLDDGAARADTTEIDGSLVVRVTPPRGIVADPVDGTIAYQVSSETQRVSED